MLKTPTKPDGLIYLLKFQREQQNNTTKTNLTDYLITLYNLTQGSESSYNYRNCDVTFKKLKIIGNEYP